MKNNVNIVYCPNRKCEHIECLRHNRNIPFDVLITRFSDNPKVNKDGKCNEYLA